MCQIGGTSGHQPVTVRCALRTVTIRYRDIVNYPYYTFYQGSLVPCMNNGRVLLMTRNSQVD